MSNWGFSFGLLGLKRPGVSAAAKQNLILLLYFRLKKSKQVRDHTCFGGNFLLVYILPCFFCLVELYFSLGLISRGVSKVELRGLEHPPENL